MREGLKRNFVMNSHIVAGVLPNITTQLHRISVYFVFSRLHSEGMMSKDEIWSTARLLCEGLITINKDLISWRICRLFSWQPLYVRNMSLKINCRISNLLSRIPIQKSLPIEVILHQLFDLTRHLNYPKAPYKS